MSTPTAFSDIEAVKLAQGMEREGRDFYRAAEQAVEDSALKSTFAMLAGEEEKHLETFSDMAGELARAKTEEYWDEPDVDAYIQALVSCKVFPKPDLAEGRAAGMSTVADALRFALQCEKDTVLYYSLCAESASGNEVRAIFCELVAEERKHVCLMAELLSKAEQDS